MLSFLTLTAAATMQPVAASPVSATPDTGSATQEAVECRHLGVELSRIIGAREACGTPSEFRELRRQISLMRLSTESEDFRDRGTRFENRAAMLFLK